MTASVARFSEWLVPDVTARVWDLRAAGIGGEKIAPQLGWKSTAVFRLIVERGGIRPASARPGNGARMSFRLRARASYECAKRGTPGRRVAGTPERRNARLPHPGIPLPGHGVVCSNFLTGGCFPAYSDHMRANPVHGGEKAESAAAFLAAADDVRLRKRTLARIGLLVGLMCVGGSLLLWPQGLFGLGRNAPAVSIALIISGALLLVVGIFSITQPARMLSRVQNTYFSTGKPDAGFVFQPDIGLPQIGHGHGGPMDASAALFANPDKVNNSRR